MSVLVGYTDTDFSSRPIQLISGKTWKGTLLGGKPAVSQCFLWLSEYMPVHVLISVYVKKVLRSRMLFQNWCVTTCLAK